MLMRKAAMVFAAATVAAILAGCGQSAIDSNQRQLQDQQAELDQLKQQVATLQNGRASYSTTVTPGGGCDSAVMAAATRKGGERMAAGDATAALGYYQDAVTACSISAEAQLNLANAFEATGDHPEAVAHYRLAAGASGSGADAGAIEKAKAALSQTQGQP